MGWVAQWPSTLLASARPWVQSVTNMSWTTSISAAPGASTARTPGSWHGEAVGMKPHLLLLLQVTQHCLQRCPPGPGLAALSPSHLPLLSASLFFQLSFKVSSFRNYYYAPREGLQLSQSRGAPHFPGSWVAR
jgi:hypothetical protein